MTFSTTLRPVLQGYRFPHVIHVKWEISLSNLGSTARRPTFSDQGAQLLFGFRTECALVTVSGALDPPRCWTKFSAHITFTNVAKDRQTHRGGSHAPRGLDTPALENTFIWRTHFNPLRVILKNEEFTNLT